MFSNYGLLLLFMGLTGLIGEYECSTVSYKGYALLRVKPRSEEQLKSIVDWTKLENSFEAWNEIRGVNHTIDVFLNPKVINLFKLLFKLKDIGFESLSDNVQELIDREKMKPRLARLGYHRGPVGEFARYEEMRHYVRLLAILNPSFVSTYSAGKTVENRDIIVIKLKTPTAKRKIWIDCGIHAREWIAPATCMWIIDKYVNDYNSMQSEIRNLLNYYEIHIVPVLNPDGYEYSHTNDRMWRKNRNPNGLSVSSNSRCIGVDLNRNFNRNWLTGGSSTDQCSDTYAGRFGGSENEVKAVENAILSNNGHWDSFITMHSYGQWWFTPYGYSRTKVPHDQRDLLEKAHIGAEALRKVNGAQYTVGSSAQLLYVASGGSEDWSKDIAGIKYSYCLELRPSDKYGGNGFLVAKSEIPKSGDETYHGLNAMFSAIKTKY